MTRIPLTHEFAPTPAEALWDALLRFENFERSSDQSARTRDGARAEPPKRQPLLRDLEPVA